MIEDALRRAQIPAWFSRGTARPHPSGRAFLALLLCAGERLSASRFAEYLSLGQVPETPGAPKWVAPEDELLGPPDQELDNEVAEPPAEADRPTPRRWERLLVDAAVIGGKAPLGTPPERPGGGIRFTREAARPDSEPETIRAAADRDAGRAAGRGHLERLAGAPGRTGAHCRCAIRIRCWRSWPNLLRWATSGRWRSKRSPRS